jgi:hypothetical protein
MSFSRNRPNFVRYGASATSGRKASFAAPLPDQLDQARLVSRSATPPTCASSQPVAPFPKQVGFEPTTYGLQNRCSSIELLPTMPFPMLLQNASGQLIRIKWSMAIPCRRSRRQHRHRRLVKNKNPGERFSGVLHHSTLKKMLLPWRVSFAHANIFRQDVGAPARGRLIAPAEPLLMFHRTF